MTYTLTRKADRARLARELATVAVASGATVETVPHLAEIVVNVAHPSGLCATMFLDKLGGGLIHWNVRGVGSARRLSNQFGGSINPHHRQKATYSTTPGNLAAELARGLAMATSGAAFEPTAAELAAVLREVVTFANPPALAHAAAVLDRCTSF